MQIPLTSENFQEQLNTSTDNFNSINESINYNSNDGFLEREIPENHSELQIECKTEKNEIYISRNIRWFIFTVYMCLQIMMNVDHGTVPAAIEEIRKDLTLDDNILGIFASLVFLGNLIGSVLSLTLINRFPRKLLLIISLFLNSVCLFTFAITDIRWIMFTNRVFVGIFQAYISIYLPVWCDQFGIGSKKSIMISLIQAGSTLGVVIGYFMTFQIKKEQKWSFSFTLQSIIIMLITLIIAMVPSIYFSSDLTLKKQDEKQDNKKNDNIAAEIDDECVFVYNKLYKNKIKDTSDNTEVILGNNKNYCTEFFQNLRIIFSEKVFVFSTIALSTLFFVITAVQYWITDYMQEVLNVEDPKDVLLTFSMICVTSPTLGLILGGWACSFIGGYESKHSILLCFLFAFCAGPFAILVPFANTLLVFSIFLWLVLFFGAAIFPTLTGIILSSLPPELRGLGNSINSFFANLFGYLPAPYLYGLINYLYKSENKRMAFKSIMTYPILCLVLISIATFFRYRKFEKSEPNTNCERTGSSKALQSVIKGIELFDVSSNNSSLNKTTDEELVSNDARIDLGKPVIEI